LAGDRFSKSYVSQIETGRVKPSKQALKYLAARLGRTPEALLQDDNVQQKVRLLLAAVQNCLRRWEIVEARDTLRNAADLALNSDDQLQLGLVHECAGHLYVATGHFDEAVTAFREAISIFRGLESMDRIASTHCSLANVLALQGKLDAAQDEIKTSQAIYNTGLEPDHLVLGRSYLVAGNTALAQGRHEAARRFLEQALSLLQGRDIVGMGESYAVLGICLLTGGDLKAAVSSFEEALRLLEGIADPPCIAVITRFHAEALARSGELQGAMAQVRRAGGLASQLGDRLGVVWAAVRLAELALALADAGTAEEASSEATRLLGDNAGGAGEGYGGPLPTPAYTGDRRHWPPVLKARLARVRSALANSAGREEESLAELKSAVRSLSGSGRGVSLLVEICRELLGRLRAAGRLEEALDCAAEALCMISDRQPVEDPVLSALELASLPSQLWFRA